MEWLNYNGGMVIFVMVCLGLPGTMLYKMITDGQRYLNIKLVDGTLLVCRIPNYNYQGFLDCENGVTVYNPVNYQDLGLVATLGESKND